MPAPAYAPLTNDMDRPLLHLEKRLGRRIRRWLSHIFLPFEPVPLGRKFVDQALLGRDSFAGEAWGRLGLTANTVEPLLVIIADIGCYPNAHFVPDDSLLFVARSSGIDCYWEQLWYRVEDALHCSIEADMLERAFRDDWTIGHFVQEVLALPRAAIGK